MSEEDPYNESDHQNAYFMGGFVAGISGVVAGYPIDTIKCKIQAGVLDLDHGRPKITSMDKILSSLAKSATLVENTQTTPQNHTHAAFNNPFGSALNSSGSISSNTVKIDSATQKMIETEIRSKTIRRLLYTSKNSYRHRKRIIKFNESWSSRPRPSSYYRILRYSYFNGSSLSALYKGVLPPIISLAPANAIAFYVEHMALQKINDITENKDTTLRS